MPQHAKDGLIEEGRMSDMAHDHLQLSSGHVRPFNDSEQGLIQLPPLGRLDPYLVIDTIKFEPRVSTKN